MSKVKIEGHGTGTGTFTVTTPSSNTDRTITLPDSTGTLATTAEVALKAPIADPTFTGTVASIISANNAQGEIAFGDPEDANIGRIAYNHPSNFLATVVNATEYMRIHSNGVTSIPSGVALGVAVSANTASNVLDDYEEGTWSPVWTPDSGTIVTNTTYTGGIYTKVGNLVTVHCRLYTNSVSSPTGKITISGLPYAIKNSPYTTPYVLWPLLGLNGSLAGMPIARTLGNTTTLQLSDWSWGTTESGSNIADKFDADVWCHAGLTYMTN